MTSFELLKNDEYLYFSLLTKYESSKKYKSSKKYNIPFISLNRSFNLKTARINPELEIKAYLLFTEDTRTFGQRKDQDERLQALENRACNMWRT